MKEAGICNGERNLFKKWCWKNWTAPCKRMKLDHFLTPYTKINSKWIKDLNRRLETTKILQESTSSNFSDISHSNILLDISPEARETKAKINYWDHIKIKSFCTGKETINRIDNPPNWRRSLQMTYPIKSI